MPSKCFFLSPPKLSKLGRLTKVPSPGMRNLMPETVLNQRRNGLAHFFKPKNQVNHSNQEILGNSMMECFFQSKPAKIVLGKKH